MSKTLYIPSIALERISKKNLCGCLVFSDPKDNSVSWKLYLNGTQLYYATSAVGQKERLACLWQKLQPNLTLPEFSSEKSEYEQLCSWWVSKHLPQTGLKKLLIKLTIEALAQVLTFEETSVKFIPHSPLDPVIISYSWRDLSEKSKELSHKWLSLKSQISSPFARLYLDSENLRHFYEFWKKIEKNQECLSCFKSRKLSFWFELLSEKHSIYDLAAQISIDPLTLAREFQTLLESGVIEVCSYGEITNLPHKKQNNQTPVIACIDDSKTVQRQVKITLELAGYKVLNITEPKSSLKMLKRETPVLILMDINMPEIDGYQLCQILNRSRKFRHIPVVIFTGRDRTFDRLRAKVVGAVHYLTKPIQPHELIDVVKSLVASQS